jgi:predicted RNA-binding Zn-ribbon protein involved in translation (DUF1610 family)
MEVTYRRAKTLQCSCLSCGFQTGVLVFKPVKDDKGNKVFVCPDCGSTEVVDADTKERMNPVSASS